MLRQKPLTLIESKINQTNYVMMWFHLILDWTRRIVYLLHDRTCIWNNYSCPCHDL